MKFGRYLKDHAVPEWSRVYISYRLLKKAIVKAHLELEEGALPRTSRKEDEEEDEGDEGRRGVPFGDRDVELGLPSGHGAGALADDEDERRGPTPPRKPAERKGGAPAPTSAPALVSDFSVVQSEPENSSGGNESEAPSAATGQSGVAFFARRDSQDSGIARPGGAATPKDSRRPSLSRKKIDSFITAAGEINPKRWRSGYPPTLSLDELLKILPPACKRFFTLLDRELDKVSSFYAEREDEAIKRFEELSTQWRELGDHKKEFQAFRAREIATPRVLVPIVSRVPGAFHIPGSNVVRRTLASKKPEDDPPPSLPKQAPDRPSLLHGRPEEYTMAKSKLKLATFEYYRSLGILKSYKVLNSTGFAKALKKYEKTTRIPCSKAYKMARLDHANFESSTRLDQLIRETEDAFTSVFEHGDRKRALERLRELTNKKMHHFASWRAGLLLGMGVPLLIEGLVKSASGGTRTEIPYWPALLQLFGALFLPIFFTLLFFLNLLAWHYGRINYVLIFELDIRTRLDIHQFLELPSIIFFIFSLLFWAAFSNFWPTQIAPSAYPLAFVVVTLAILLSPFPFAHPSARWWMVRSWIRVLTGGLLRVEFRDFFLGDELNSLYYTVYNLGFLVCTYKHHWPNNVAQVCSTNATWTSAVLASLPAFLRFGQSIRRYVDSDGLVIHLLNAGKYSLSIAYFFAYFSWRVHGSANVWRKAIWILFGVINSSYVSTWDIVMDWSLLRKHSKNFLLRPELGFFKDRPWMYYVAIVADVILRFSWVWYLAPGYPTIQLRGFILALLEVGRRVMWNAFRVESEHIGNVDGYRVTRNVPLPYVMPGTSAVRDIDDSEPDPRTRKQQIFEFLHAFKASLVRDFLPLTNVRFPAFSTSTSASRYPDRSTGKELSSKRRDSSSDPDGIEDDEDEDDSYDAMRAEQEQAEEIQRASRQSEAAEFAVLDGMDPDRNR